MVELSLLTFSVNIDKHVVFPAIWLFLLIKDLIVCSQINATLLLLVFFFTYGLMLPISHGFVCFHLLCAEFLVESSVVVAWLSYIVLVSIYRGRFLLFCQF
jgi:hypothetical protein